MYGRKSRRTAMTGLGIVLSGALLTGGGTSGQALDLDSEDLEFALQQILIAEAHAAGGALAGNGPLQIPTPDVPFGLRTTTGVWNNIVPGRSLFGAADQIMPRLLTPTFRPAQPLTIDPDGPGPAVVGAPTDYSQTSGFVEDGAVRTISNLIIDESVRNPAAVAAASRTLGSTQFDDDNNPATPDLLEIPNVTTDEGLSSPYNSWFTFFGQFFDHGLDLIGKGGAGTVYIPLQPDDPLYVVGGQTNFMMLTRATNQPGATASTADDIHEHANSTTPYVDQNQTYTSHPSHQAFLREYVRPGAQSLATGLFLDAPGGGLARWDDIQAQAQSLLGIQLTDLDVLNVPLLSTDLYGKLNLSANGYARLCTSATANPCATTLDGDPTANGGLGVSTATARRTGHAFLDDIAHHAAPSATKTPDADTLTVDDNVATTYDDELLGLHYITGDGRGNENVALTTVHFVFHAEHNRIAEEIMTTGSGLIDPARITEWQTSPGVWNGERVFQAARLATEMQYQHLVFEEFGRRIQPDINVIGVDGYHDEINPAITSEFANVVYRFGHSMMNETVQRTGANGEDLSLGLIPAFLTPEGYLVNNSQTEGAAAVVRGTTTQVGQEIDEFITNALRDNLVGLPLDLGVLNLARGRDTGMPGLNAARRQFYAATGDAALAPYNDWEEFGLALRNPESLANFIAAYGTHTSITSVPNCATPASTNCGFAARRLAAQELVSGVDGPDANATVVADRIAFMTGTGAFVNAAGLPTTGLEGVDFWVGGLAEAFQPFGGLLGPTFNFVFETQMEDLQNADRLYYLLRLRGLNLLAQMEENSFAELIMRNTGTENLPGMVFSAMDITFDMDNITVDQAPLLTQSAGFTRFTGGEHIVMGGTDLNDRLWAGIGDDTIWGNLGNDRLEGGAGNDMIMGGEGNDVITDSFGTDVLKGGHGNDVVIGGNGLGDLVFGGTDKDYLSGGNDSFEIFAGAGDDILVGGAAADVLIGNLGSDWFQGGGQNELIVGDSGSPYFNDTSPSHDVFFGEGGNDDYDAEGGDDIMVYGPGVERGEGMFGFDWVTLQGDTVPGDQDMNLIGALPANLANSRDRFGSVEAISGANLNDILRGTNNGGAVLLNQPVEANDLTTDGVARIAGLADIVPATVLPMRTGNIMLGGDGSDILEGRGENDIIDGDRYLNVRLSVRTNPADALTQTRTVTDARQLQADLTNGVITPDQVVTVREVLVDPSPAADVDVAIYSGPRDDYDLVQTGPATWTVSHTANNAIVNDGVDTLHNMEVVRFSDVDEFIAATPNSPATGTVTINDTTPTEDQLLTVTSVINDPNGVNNATVLYTWQQFDGASYTTVGTGTTFTPNDGQVGDPLRVIVTFFDLVGFPEQLNSTDTAAVVNVNDLPTGGVTILNPRPTETIALTGQQDIADADGLGPLTYRWERGPVNNAAGSVVGGTFTPIVNPLGNSPVYTPVQADVNRKLRLSVLYTDGFGTATVVTSAETAVTGDFFAGGAGADTWTGTAGDDIAEGGGGDDTLTGGIGNDIFRYNGAANGFDAVVGGGGTDIMIAGSGGTVFGLRSVTEVETISAGTTAGATILGNTAANTLNFGATTLTDITLIDGGDGSDSITGSPGPDRINGSGGNDTISAGNGNDIIDGGTGNDPMTGGNDNDTFLVGLTAGTDTFTGSGGTDVVQATAANVIISTATFGTANSIETITAGGFTNVTFVGSTAANTLSFAATALTGLASVDGLAGNDSITGTNLADVIVGSAGTDNLQGSGGNDILTGGADNDTIGTGTGNDVLMYPAGLFGADVISAGFDADATGGQDVINLTGQGVTAANFAARVTIAASGTNVLITVRNAALVSQGTISLTGIAVTAITTADFVVG